MTDLDPGTLVIIYTAASILVMGAATVIAARFCRKDSDK